MLEQLLDAAERVASVCTALQENVARNRQSLSESQDRAQKVIERLQSLLELVVDATAHSAGDEPRPHIDAPESSRPEPATSDVRDRLDLDAADTQAAGELAKDNRADAPAINVYFLRPFQVDVNDTPIEHWPNCKAKTIFKHLVLTRDRPATRDYLMELFWPDAEPEAARVNLNVALYNIRSALRRIDPTFPFVIHDGGHYSLNRGLSIWTDVDAFAALHKRAAEFDRTGDTEAAAREFEACVELYRNELLAEDRYEDWIVPIRDQLRDRYLSALKRLNTHYFGRADFAQCVTICRKLLVVDCCNEEAHCQLMRCYAKMGQLQLAQMQYRTCVQSLAREMGVPPNGATTRVYRDIVQRTDSG